MCGFFNRALFGYEGQSNALKVVSTGNDGLIELTEELNSGKILYAFVSIANDGTNLTKYLLINWQVRSIKTGFFISFEMFCKKKNKNFPF